METAKTFFSSDGILVAKIVNHDIDEDRFTIEPIRKMSKSISNINKIVLFDLEHKNVYRLKDDLKIINMRGVGLGEFFKITRLCIRATNASKLDFNTSKFMVVKNDDLYKFDEIYRSQYHRIFETIIDRIL